MARISNDDNSWKASGVKRRDFRAANDAPEVPKKNPKKRTKKDTKTWCRGKEGREHVVVDKTIPKLSDYTCCSPEEKRHYFWVHRSNVKCINCGMDAWSLPDKARAQVDPDLAKQLELAEKWCQEGHLYDWESNLIDPPSSRGKRLAWLNYINYSWENQVCAMCGKRGKGRRRRQS